MFAAQKPTAPSDREPALAGMREEADRDTRNPSAKVAGTVGEALRDRLAALAVRVARDMRRSKSGGHQRDQQPEHEQHARDRRRHDRQPDRGLAVQNTRSAAGPRR